MHITKLFLIVNNNFHPLLIDAIMQGSKAMIPLVGKYIKIYKDSVIFLSMMFLYWCMQIYFSHNVIFSFRHDFTSDKVSDITMVVYNDNPYHRNVILSAKYCLQLTITFFMCRKHCNYINGKVLQM